MFGDLRGRVIGVRLHVRSDALSCAFPLRASGGGQRARTSDGERDRAANEMTVDDWDPVSEQPMFKATAARGEPYTLGSTPAGDTVRVGKTLRELHGSESALAVELSRGATGTRRNTRFVTWPVLS